MTFRERLRDRQTVMTIGFIALALANVWNWFLHRGPRFGETVTDVTMGILFGIAIGCLLVSLRLPRRG